MGSKIHCTKIKKSAQPSLIVIAYLRSGTLSPNEIYFFEKVSFSSFRISKLDFSRLKFGNKVNVNFQTLSYDNFVTKDIFIIFWSNEDSVCRRYLFKCLNSSLRGSLIKLKFDNFFKYPHLTSVDRHISNTLYTRWNESYIDFYIVPCRE